MGGELRGRNSPRCMSPLSQYLSPLTISQNPAKPLHLYQPPTCISGPSSVKVGSCHWTDCALMNSGMIDNCHLSKKTGVSTQNIINYITQKMIFDYRNKPTVMCYDVMIKNSLSFSLHIAAKRALLVYCSQPSEIHLKPKKFLTVVSVVTQSPFTLFIEKLEKDLRRWQYRYSTPGQVSFLFLFDKLI